MKFSDMTKLLILAAFLLHAVNFYGQEKLIHFGKASEAELALTDCDFDPGADMICLLEEGTVMYNLNGNTPVLETTVRKRFKVLKTSAIPSANVKLRYYSKDRYEDIANIDGYVYNKDDQGKITVTKLARSDVYRKKVDDEYSEVTFALPGVKEGSVYEYRYKKYRYTIGGIEPWYFQHTYPTKYSAYHLMIPEYFDFTYQAIRRQEMEVKADGNSAKGAFYSMKNIASMHSEPFMAGSNDFLQRVNFNLVSINPPGEAPIIVGKTWEGISKELMDNLYFGQQLRKNIHGTDELQHALDSLSTKQQKLRAIYQYVQKNMAWNGNYSLFSADNGIKDAWDKKQGSTADINMVLIDLLRDNDIAAYPILVSTRDNGAVRKSYPDLWQFNATMAYARIDTTDYILNAADKMNPVGLIPYEVQYTNGYLVDNKKSGWVDIFDTNKKDKSQLTVSINLLSDGKLNGFGRISYLDYARNRRLDDYQKKNLKTILSTTTDITLKVDSMAVSNENNSELPLDVYVNYTGAAQKSGNYLLLPYDLFLGFDKNPFTAEKRQTNINFGFLQDFQINGYINLNDGYTLESMPKSITMRLGDNSIIFKRIFQKTADKQLAFQLSIKYLRPEYSTIEYPDIKAYYQKMYELLAEKIVLKKM